MIDKKNRTLVKQLEIDKMKECFCEGLTSRETALLMNRSKTTVLNHWKDMNLKRERRPKDKIDHILSNSRKSYDKLADETGFCTATVRTILIENGITPVLPKMLSFDAREERNKKIIDDFKLLGSYTLVADNNKVSPSLVSLIVPDSHKDKYGNHRFLSEDEHEYIIENYELKTSTEIASKLGMSRSCILNVWLREKLRGKDIGRQYYCDFDYFETIDSAEKAYFVGFIMADGCIYKREGHQKSLHITIHKKDVDVLEFFNKQLKSNYPINQHCDDYVSLTIVSDKMVEDLMRLGVTARKTWGDSIDISQIQKKYQLDFVFGFFDGDGCISAISSTGNSHSTMMVSICGNEDNMSQLQSILFDHNIKSSLQRIGEEKYKEAFYNLSMTDMTNKYSFLKPFIHKKYSGMNRKVSRASDFVSRVENNITNRAENIKAVEYYNMCVISNL